jgi:HK97 family phage prohead protease
MENLIKNTIFKNNTSQIKDLDESKGIVQIYVNSYNIEDTDGEISVKGSFKKTIKENMSRIKHLLNHNMLQLLGLPIKMVEDDFGLLVTSQMNLKKQSVRDVYEDYKLFKEHDRTLEHSVRVNAIKRDPNNEKMVTEWLLWEYSTLYGWGANSETPLVNIKSLDDLELMINGGNYSDEKSKYIEYLYEKLKALLTQPGTLSDEPLPLDDKKLLKYFYNKLKI